MRLKCIVGATIATPIILIIFGSFILGVSILANWIAEIDTYYIVPITLIAMIAAFIFIGLYKSCKEYHEYKKEV